MPAIPSVRKHLCADALVALLRGRFSKIKDPRPGNTTISLTDALMSAYAMFALKDCSLLAFDERRQNDTDNLRSLYTIERVPCDTQMRVILDPVSPEELRPAFQDVFRQVQRGKVLESYRYLDEGYLVALDGTEYFYSDTVHCPSCMEKHHQRDDGTTTISYHHQMLGAVILHPDKSAVIPLTPEPIIKQDGAVKNDCERNAARRFLGQFRVDHPWLQVVVVEDALSSNAPHIGDLKHYGMHFILGVKEGDHEYLFAEVRRREEEGDPRVQWVTLYVRTTKTKMKYVFSIVRDVPLNGSNEDVRVTFVRCLEVNEEDGTTRIFTWITDLEVTQGNVWKIMRAGRARWKIENETFNTLKNQGYHYEHNYGHGEQNLSVVFALLMMLAFMIDQVLQLCDPLFQGALQRLGSKRALWERQRAMVFDYQLRSLRELFEALCYGYKRPRPRIQYLFNSS
jgi:Transposase DDE domain